MPASKHLKVLSVRLPETEVRRVKSAAASRGLSVQEAVRQALEVWISQPQRRALARESIDTLQGSLAGTDIEKFRRQDRDLELAKEQRWS
jgi:hypothetical protein